MKGVLSTAENSLLTAALYGGKIDWQAAAAQALGSEIGNTLTTTLPNLDPKADYHKQNQAALAGNRQAAAVYGDATGRNGLGLQRQTNPTNGLATFKDDAITSASNLTDTNGLNTRTSQGAATLITSGNPTHSSTTPAFQKNTKPHQGSSAFFATQATKKPQSFTATLQDETASNTHNTVVNTPTEMKKTPQNAAQKANQASVERHTKSNSLITRAFGVAQSVGGALELVGGAGLGLLTAETGVGAAVGAFGMVDGWDNIQTGLRTAWTGQTKDTSLTTVMKNLGASNKTAMLTELGLDVALPFGEAGALYTAGKLGLFAKSAGVKSANGVVEGSSIKVGKFDDTIKLIQDYLGKDMVVIKPGPGKSDLILRSADKTKQIRFDIANSHGMEPHVNVELWEPRNSYPGDKGMNNIENLHVFPGVALEEQSLFIEPNKFKF